MTQPTIRLYRGDSYPIAFTLRDASSGAAVDLTGCTLTMTVDGRKNPADESTQVMQLTGVLADDPATGVVYFTPAVGDTATAGEYFYDVQMTDADDNVRTVAKSTFVIEQDITK